MVVVPKPGNQVRICGDFVQLNKAVLREVYPMPTTEETLAKLSGANFVTKLDANAGFWQKSLSEESKLLTTFITPWGRFCYKRLPFGISSAPEHFQKCIRNILEGLDGVVNQVDDILVYAETEEMLDHRVMANLERLQSANVTLNPKKCKFSQTQVQFLGHLVGRDGIQADPEKVEAIMKMPEPANVSDLRRFLGMVNQMSKFLPSLAELSAPLRNLLSTKNVWLWNLPQQEAFERIKQALMKAPAALGIYDAAKESTISVDASSHGLGAVLKQQQQFNSNKKKYTRTETAEW